MEQAEPAVRHSLTIRDTEIKVTDILGMISKGYSYYQILLSDSRLTLSDIMVTAKLAQELIQEFVAPDNQIIVEGVIQVVANSGRIQNLTELRKEHPRAFEKWTETEEGQLTEMYSSGRSLAEIARVLKRKRGAVRTRLKKLGLIDRDGA